MKSYDVYGVTTNHCNKNDCLQWLASIGVSDIQAKITIENEEDGDGPLFRPCWIEFSIDRGKLSVASLERAMQSVDGSLYLHVVQNEYDRVDVLQSPASICLVIEDRASRSGSLYDTRYSYANACKACGAGRRQIGELVARVAKKKGDRRFVETRDGDWLIRKDCARSLCESVAEAANNLMSLSKKSHANSADYLQILPDYEFPPMQIEQSGVIIDSDNPFYCKVCRRCGYFGGGPGAFRPTYRENDLAALRMPPFAITPEKRAYSDLSHRLFGCEYVALGWLVARADVAVALYDMKIEHVFIIPVDIVKAP